MLEVRPPGSECELHIGDGSAGQNAAMRFFLQMGQDQALPVAVEHVLTAYAVEYQTAAARQRLQEQVHFGIMAQRLKMPDSLDGGGNGFAIGHAAGANPDLPAEAVANQAAQDFQLHLAHELELHLAELLVPCNVKLRFFFLELAQPIQGDAHVALRRKIEPVGHDRGQNRRRLCLFRAEYVPGVQRRQTGHGTDVARAYLIDCQKARAGVPAELRDLFLQLFAVLRRVGYRCSHAQAAACDLEPRQACALCVPGDFIHPRGELFGIDRADREAAERIKKFVHALQMQRCTKEAGEQRL